MNQIKKDQWSSIKERGGMLPLMLMLGFYRLGGRWLCRFVLLFVIFWYWFFSKSARTASLQYLTKLHNFSGDQSPFKTTPTIAHTYSHLMEFGECILDKIEGWLGHIPEENLSLFGHENIRERYQKGTVIVVSHFGNIELLRAVKSENPQKINILVYQKHASKFNAFLKKLNSHADVNLVSVDELGIETALVLQEKMAQGEWIIVAADRVPVQSDRVQSIDFLGEAANWPQGSWMLASLLKVPVVAVFCYRVNKKFEVHIHKISDQLQFSRKARMQEMRETTQKYIELLEQHCIRVPYQWFNFYNFWNKK
jgi:predicted LPLAT superfamily acyltransferase